mmetsp:Transcript_4704/g.6997  ORF Transcript_4704/g.6997 Transcript_4704/m.6997 type:complete len:633 (+) Transcript_4704:67-1965(+)|eukprot:CAMPEP_0167755772 /NCGR_PEP_ID=MMETSP0110_2-20121227/9011_1 /TAXON_ID=629695 /ORGANISM="Gymnochlora sp., Strain CCMP2014" /LENGTH=632 /DNA_ID=CAMNT_0007641799 /DNA_START=16 /DNA_END=1914 /DNA_ORIENTATION=+
MSTCFFVSKSSTGTSDFVELCISSSSITRTTNTDILLASEESVGSLQDATDVMWILVTAIFVFWMQAGFAMLEAGTVRPKNTNNILFKNIMDAAIGCIAFWLLGYSLAFGNNRTVADGSGRDNGFIGAGNWALQNFNDDTQYHLFFFQWTFASAATTIVSGSVAERCRLEAYFIYSLFISIFVYPVVVHWFWSPTGWLSPFYTDDGGRRYLSKNGVIDFAGSGVVHMVGGFSGLIGSIAIGPRRDFHDKNKLKGANELLCSLGVGILWMGWYGFNAGSTLAAGSGMAINLASKIVTVTTISAASAIMVGCLIAKSIHGCYKLPAILNSAIAGLVAITAPCAVVEPWAAMIIGIVGSLIYALSSEIIKNLNIDDPLDAFPVHGCAGVWGLLSVGIFATRSNISRAYGFDNDAMTSGNQFVNQLLGAVVIIAWTVTNMSALFFTLKFIGFLRITAEQEEKGLDVAEHGVPWIHRNARVERGSRTEGKSKTTKKYTSHDFSKAHRKTYKSETSRLGLHRSITSPKAASGHQTPRVSGGRNIEKSDVTNSKQSNSGLVVVREISLPMRQTSDPPVENIEGTSGKRASIPQDRIRSSSVSARFDQPKKSQRNSQLRNFREAERKKGTGATSFEKMVS